MNERGSGILFHISSLPTSFGIGDLGPSAFQFADLLSDTKQRFWQILPLTPTDARHGNSPYHSDSAFAANPLFISPEILLGDGWLDHADRDILQGDDH
jgi:4-alpha-glucanotransferase